MDQYAYYQCRGKDVTRTGSGWVCGVSFLGGPCWCHECSAEGVQPRERCWEVTLVTACQLIYNTEEARSAKIELFYDDRSKSDVKVLYCSEVEYSNMSEDRSALDCVTHDLDLVLQLE